MKRENQKQSETTERKSTGAGSQSSSTNRQSGKNERGQQSNSNR